MKNLPKKIARLLVAAVAFSPLIIPSNAAACSCVMQAESNQEAFGEADAVFAGRVTGFSGSDIKKITFDVSRTWKGPNVKNIAAYTSGNSASCGWSPTVGNEYLVYAYSQASNRSHFDKPDSQLWISLCSRVFLLADANTDLTSLGQGNIPTGGSIPRKQSPAYHHYLLGGAILLGLGYGAYKLSGKLTKKS